MEDKVFTINYNSNVSDESIHKFAVALLLSRYSSEFILTQGDFSYQVMGGKDGYLYYRKRTMDEWILIANWCVYGLFILVRYRKPIWLRAMYKTLFKRMNFASVVFDEYSIELVGSDGQTLRSRRFRLSPPSAFDKVMSEQFNLPKDQMQFLKSEIGLDFHAK